VAAAVSVPMDAPYREERPGAASGAICAVILAAGTVSGENP
jgi:hypothetical protein